MTRIAPGARAGVRAGVGPGGRAAPYGVVKIVRTVAVVEPTSPDERRPAALDPRRLLPPRAACAPRADPRSAATLAQALVVEAATARARGSLGRRKPNAAWSGAVGESPLATARDAVLFGIDSADAERRPFLELLLPSRTRCIEH
jgi:hypothetical protein